MAIKKTFKSVNDEFFVELVYSTPDLEAGETITQVSAAATPAGLTLGTAQIGADGKSVAVKVTGGTSGVKYLVQFTVTTSAGNKYANPYKDAHEIIMI